MQRLVSTDHDIVPDATLLEHVIGLIARSNPDLEFAYACSNPEQLIRQGSVWKGNMRLKNPALTHFEVAAINPENPLSICLPRYPINEYRLDPVHIRYEDDDMLIVYKEADINTCQSVYSDIDCLTHGVQNYLGGDYQINTINRLDRSTQGLVVYGKHKEAEKRLYRRFMNRRIHKRYLALTPVFTLPEPTRPTPWRMTIDAPLEHGDKIKDAITLVSLTNRTGAHLPGTDIPVYCWNVLPQTGRTHQIRKHFAAQLVPILGDPVYGGLSGRPDEKLMLACVAYRFRHPFSGRTIRVEWVPPDFVAFSD